MARLARASPKSFLFPSSSPPSPKTLASPLQHHILQPSHGYSPQSKDAAYPSFFQTRAAHIVEICSSPTESKMLQMLRAAMDQGIERISMHKPITTCNSFTAEECPGERLIMLRSKFGLKEEIEIKVPLDHRGVVNKTPGDGMYTVDQLHVHSFYTCHVNISRMDNVDKRMELICWAWRGLMDIKMVSMRPRNSPPIPPFDPLDFTGSFNPLHFSNLKAKLHDALGEFLRERGLDDELALFIHNYMPHKLRSEQVRWLEGVASFVKK